MDRLTATRVFITVVEQGSLTRAADTLDMSTAMVSRYLAAMETWLHARLLHRTTRRISLTDAGESALSSCRHLLESAEDVESRAQAAGREASGRLRVASSPSFAEAQLAAALVEFQRLHPKVSASLLTAEHSVDLAAERIDLAVRITNTLEPTLISRRLATCRSALCASREYLQAHGTPRREEDLRGHRCLNHALVTTAQFRVGAGPAELAGTEAFTSNDTAVLRRAALAGAGIAILPTYLVGADLREGRLKRVLPSLEPDPLGIHAIFLSRQHLPLALRLLIDFLAQRFGGSAAPWDRGATGRRASPSASSTG
ncbi:LysR family transcriptional regulator [Schlegelella sp. S2-27]|uniref:LysR family transcriptional regulator n=1 Tax=Caldimonas mangrovi TaxID=2944811 RepID=A0ABT0YMZ4_9BURK|nr:LysR family transcriptional regulator [Caldimonas mangrovi]MCM5679799.1 LysR family transcriptional regulator [Caldimonas mangrovi]